jgi:uroporphyrinogen-III synthase
MRVLVIRPEPDAESTAEALRARGHTPLITPLLTVRFTPGPALTLEGIDGVLATSANGVRALAKRTTRRDVPVFAVGRQSAEAALAAGFLRVESADGDAAALADAVPRWLASGTLFHAAGGNSRSNLADALTAKGYAVRHQVLYEVSAATQLPPQAVEALKAGALDAVLFFSPMSAAVFWDCVVAAGREQAVGRLIGVCISAATAKRLPQNAFADLRLAEKPDQEAMLACLDHPL